MRGRGLILQPSLDVKMLARTGQKFKGHFWQHVEITCVDRWLLSRDNLWSVFTVLFFSSIGGHGDKINNFFNIGIL